MTYELSRVPRPYSWETELLDLYEHLLEHGDERGDRTGTGTLALFGEKLVIDLEEGFPLVTTKQTSFKLIATELLWFLEGSGDERRLAELVHGTRDPNKKTIWSPNAEATSGSKFQPARPGDLGRVYGVQWRRWQHLKLKDYSDYLSHEDGGYTYFGAKVLVEELDQVRQLVKTLKTNPTDRRMIITAWNPGELSDMALPPCHMFAQFFVSNDRKLSCQMYQRSVDTFLGLPFNIASYALLTHMLAHVTGLGVGQLHMVLGDTHIYRNHVEQVKEQLKRQPLRPPTLNIKRKIEDIDGFKLEDLELLCYESWPAIKAPMAA